MTDQWITNPLPPPNDWNTVPPCLSPGGPSIADGLIITGVPAIVVSPNAWGITLNDGSVPPNFSIDHYSASSVLVDSPLVFSGVDGSASFFHPVFLSRDPVEDMEAVTKEYVDGHASGIPEPPDNQTYGRTLGDWVEVVPASGGTFTGSTSFGVGGAVTSGAMLFAGSAVCSLPTIAQLQVGGGSLGQVPVTDGNGNLSWVTPVTGGPYLPISGGTITGSLAVNQVLTVQGANSLVLNAAAGNQRAILGQTLGLTRWQLQLGDGTTEGLNNTGSNFSLVAYSTNSTFLGSWLTIARADGSTVFNGSGVTIQGGLAVNGLLALADPSNLAIYGGAAGQFLSTNGSGILSWATPSGGGGGPPVTISDTAPTSPAVGALWWDSVGGQLYVWYTDANSSQWVIAVNGGGPAPSTAPPLMDGAASVGTSAAYSRGDHVHPTDTSRYAASNPSGFQTAAQVTASLGNYLPLSGGTLTGTLTVQPSLNILANATSAGIGFFNSASTLLGQLTYNAQSGQSVWSNVILASSIGLTGDVNASPGSGHNFIVSPGVGYQTGGGTWMALSDARIKTVDHDYAPGLDEVLALRPVVYTYKGNDSFTAGEPSMHQWAADEGKQFVGLIAQEVEPIFPEMVTARAGFIDGEPVTDLRDLNTGPLIFALVNAVKTLNARIAQLEASR